MTDKEIDDFIENSSEEKLKDYFDSLVQKLQTLNAKNDKLSLLLGLLILSYFVINKNVISNINLGPISINDISNAKLFIPLIFAFVLLIFATLNAHKAVLLQNIRKVGVKYYKVRDAGNQEFYSNRFLRMLLPFSFWEEISTIYFSGGKFGCMAVLLTIPLFLLILIPFFFEYFALKIIIIEKWHNSLLEKGIVILTIWILVAAIFYYFKLFEMKIKEEKEKK
jgi:hypothetical protein